MKNLCVSLLALFTACAPARSPRTVGGFAHPESVIGDGDRLYVSNIGTKLEPLAKDGDGFISELDADGGIRTLRAFTGLDAPKGMAIVGRRLFVADVDRVVGFDLDSHQAVQTSPRREGALLNDLALDRDGTLLVSDTAGGLLLRLDIASNTFTEVARDMPGANGIAVGSDTIWVVGIGARFEGGDLFAVPRAGGLARRLSAHGVFDGIAVRGDTLVISDWVGLTPAASGKIGVYRRDGSVERELSLPAALHGPADFFYDARADRLVIPCTLDGAIRFVPL